MSGGAAASGCSFNHLNPVSIEIGARRMRPAEGPR